MKFDESSFKNDTYQMRRVCLNRLWYYHSYVYSMWISQWWVHKMINSYIDCDNESGKLSINILEKAKCRKQAVLEMLHKFFTLVTNMYMDQRYRKWLLPNLVKLSIDLLRVVFGCKRRFWPWLHFKIHGARVSPRLIVMDVVIGSSAGCPVI